MDSRHSWVSASQNSRSAGARGPNPPQSPHLRELIVSSRSSTPRGEYTFSALRRAPGVPSNHSSRVCFFRAPVRLKCKSPGERCRPVRSPHPTVQHPTSSGAGSRFDQRASASCPSVWIRVRFLIGRRATRPGGPTRRTQSRRSTTETGHGSRRPTTERLSRTPPERQRYRTANRSRGSPGRKSTQHQRYRGV